MAVRSEQPCCSVNAAQCRSAAVAIPGAYRAHGVRMLCACRAHAVLTSTVPSAGVLRDDAVACHSPGRQAQRGALAAVRGGGSPHAGHHRRRDGGDDQRQGARRGEWRPRGERLPLAAQGAQQHGRGGRRAQRRGATPLRHPSDTPTLHTPHPVHRLNPFTPSIPSNSTPSYPPPLAPSSRRACA